MMYADIQIEGGEIKDSIKGYGMVYIKSDHYLAAPVREYESTTYAEEPGEHIDPRTVEQAFDCKFVFVAETDGRRGHVNTLVEALNGALFERDGSGILRARKTTVYDRAKHRVITGYPKRVSLPEDDDLFIVRGQELAVIGLTLRVTDPRECNFDLWEGIGAMVVGRSFRVG